jgi:hypothetical protein
MDMKSTLALLANLVLILTVSLISPGFAQSTQASYTVNLNSFSLQVSYPSEVMPSDNVTVNIQGNPKSSSVYLQSLTATTYYADAAGLHQLATETLVSNSGNIYGYGYSGSYTTGSLNKSFTVNVPRDAPRTSLVAIFSETVLSTYYYGSYFRYPYCWWRDPIFCSYYSYSSTTDAAIAPLSYIKAATPEYVTLRSEYQMLQQQINQSQAQNQQLQTTISQQSTTISQLNQQLAFANSMTQRYQMLALGLGILAVASLAFSTYQWRTRKKKQKTVKTKAS